MRGAEVGELLASPDVDAVAICTSTDTHAELIDAAARAGKAIFCEKPVSLDLAQVDRALAAVDEAGVAFQIGFNRRFDPAHASVRAAVAAGEVGDPHLVRISSRDPAPPPIGYIRESGGIFLDMTIHDFDMARFVTGSEVVEVFARGVVRVDPAIGEAGDIGYGVPKGFALSLGAVDLLLLPYGTALGSYALWVLLNEDRKKMFAEN